MSNVIKCVLFQKDHCHLIFSYLTIKDLFSTAALLSSFHYKLLTCNDKQSIKLVQAGLRHDFGWILSLITLSNKQFNIVKDVCKFYNDWDYLIDLATRQLEWIENFVNNKFITDEKVDGTDGYCKFDATNEYDIRMIFFFRRFDCVYHWLAKVERISYYIWHMMQNMPTYEMLACFFC